MAEYRLDNGLRVIVAPDHASPGVAVNLWYDVGSADETPGRTGFAHLFEHLMFQGSGHVAAGEHFSLLEGVGGISNATTSFDRTNYFETVPPGALDLALWLEADRMAGLAIDQANLDAQRDVVKEEKRQSYDNQPYGNLLELLLGQHFAPDHPYGHTTIGSMADLDAATLDDVHDFFATWYGPDNAVLTIAGPINPEDGHSLADRYFGHLTPRPQSTSHHTPVGRRMPGRLDASADVPHDVVYLSWAAPPITHSDAEALDVLLALLSDGMSSRLHRQLVKEHDIAESVGSSTLSLARTQSIATISARLDAGQSLDAAEDAAVTELRRLFASPPPDTELDRTRASLERYYLTALASVESRADLISATATHFGDPAWLNGYLDRLNALSVDRLLEVADRWLRPDDRYVLRYHTEESA